MRDGEQVVQGDGDELFDFTGERVYNMSSESAWNPLTLTGRFFVATTSYCPGHSSGRMVNAISGQPPLVFGFQATMRPELCLFLFLGHSKILMIEQR